MSSITATADTVAGNIRIDVEQTVVRDTFTRSVASGWGSANSGQAWTTTGGAAADYSTTGTRGQIALTSVNVARHTQIDGPLADSDQTITLVPGVVATGAPIELGLMSRRDSAANTEYYATASFGLSGVLQIIIRRVIAGTATTLATVTSAIVYTNTTNLRLRFATCGTTLMAKAWVSTVNEPTAWDVTVTDPGILSTATTMATGVRAILTTGNTNTTPVNTQYDDYTVIYGQPVKLFRVTPDSTRTEVRGSPFYTELATSAANTAIATVYDNEAPFDTSLTYELWTLCSSAAVTGSAAVTLSSGSNGWIRDPENPSLNFVLDFSTAQFNTCDATDQITLTDWDARVSRNASGQFDTVNSQRGRFVGAARKKYDSVFHLASKSLTDIDTIYAMFLPGKIVMVSLPASYGWGRPYGSDYISVGDLVENPANTDDYTDPQRTWDVPFRLEYAPADVNEGMTGGNGVGGGGATYDDLAASAIGVSFTALTATGETYQQVAQGVGY